MIIGLGEIVNLRVKPLNLPKEMGKFLGFLPDDKQWSMLIFGGSFSGKSTFALYLSQILSNYGNTLYGNLEESIFTGTIQQKIKSLNVKCSKVDFLERNDIEDFYNALDKKQYKYVVMDSLSEVANTTMETIRMLDITKKYKDTSFIFILHADKMEENYIGSSKIKHKVDIAIMVKDTIAYMLKNRLASGTKNNIYKIFKRKN